MAARLADGYDGTLVDLTGGRQPAQGLRQRPLFGLDTEEVTLDAGEAAVDVVQARIDGADAGVHSIQAGVHWPRSGRLHRRIGWSRTL